MYALLDFNALYALRANQNTGLYLQTLVNVIHAGSTFNYADGKPHAWAHNQWLLFVLVPVIAAIPRPETLIVVQTTVLAAAAPVLFLLSRELGAGRTVATRIAFVYLIAPSTQGWAYGGFVPEVAVPLLAFGLALAIRRRSFAAALLCAIALAGVKEDQALFLAWTGAFVAAWFDRRIGLALIAVATVSLSSYYGAAWIAGFSPEHPRYAPADNQVFPQLAFLVEMLVPLAFAPLWLGTRILFAAPLLFELFFAQDRPVAMYRAGSYYTITLVTVAVIGAAAVLAKRERHSIFALACALVMALLFNTTVLHLGRRPFSLDPQYPMARAWALVQKPVDFPCEDEGAWVVASANRFARLGSCSGPLLRERPAWQDVPLGSKAGWTAGP